MSSQENAAEKSKAASQEKVASDPKLESQVKIQDASMGDSKENVPKESSKASTKAGSRENVPVSGSKASSKSGIKEVLSESGSKASAKSGPKEVLSKSGSKASAKSGPKEVSKSGSKASAKSGPIDKTPESASKALNPDDSVIQAFQSKESRDKVPEMWSKAKVEPKEVPSMPSEIDEQNLTQPSAYKKKKSTMISVISKVMSIYGQSRMPYNTTRLQKAPVNQQQAEPTYELEPDRLFSAGCAERIILRTFNQFIPEDLEYTNSHEIGIMSKRLAREIEYQVKQLDYKRYKIIALVHFVQLHKQCMKMSSRCLWDATKDTWASATWCNKKVAAIGQVYATYYE